MADTTLQHDIIADKLLFYLRNSQVFAPNVYRGYEDEFHSRGNYQVGDTIRVHLPNKARTVAGPDITSALIDARESSINVVLDEHRTHPFDFTATQMTLDIERFAEKYLKPGAIAMANYVDRAMALEYVNIYNLVGTAGTTPSDFSALIDAGVRMDEEAVPQEDRSIVFSAKAAGSMADGELKTLFNQPIVGGLLRKGFKGVFNNFNTFMDQNIQSHTRGTVTGSGGALQVESTSSQEDTTLSVKGGGNTLTMVAGDIFTIASVAGVNPVSGDAWEGNQARQFVVTTTGTTDGSGDIAALAIAPEIISSAAGSKQLPYQTVNDLPATNDVITMVGSVSEVMPRHMAFHKDCFALTMVPFDKPDGETVNWATGTDPDKGISITFASQFDILLHKTIHRADILFAADTIRPELGCLVTG